MFIHCPYSSEVWDLLTKSYGVSWCKLDDILDFFSQWDSLYRGMKRQMISSWNFSHFCWGIWKEINNRIFREREAPTFVLADKIDRIMRKKTAIRKGGDLEEVGKSMERKKDREVKK